LPIKGVSNNNMEILENIKLENVPIVNLMVALILKITLNSIGLIVN